MKIRTNQFGFIYKNRGKFTKTPYSNALFTSVKEANMFAKLEQPTVKKNLKLVRVTLETV